MKLGILSQKIKTRTNKLFKRPNYGLLLELIRAKFKITDHNSVLGVFWSLIVPVVMFLAMYLVFRTSFGQGVPAYPFYLLVGIICVNFFATATTYIMKIFFLNRTIVLNSMLPREILILSDMFIHTYKFIIELILCLIISYLYGLFSWGAVLLLLPLAASYIAFILGIGLILSLIYCFARDIEHIWAIASRLLYFVTPIFYTLDKISPLARKIIYWGNPLTPFLVSFRGILMGQNSTGVFTYMYSLLLGAGFFIIGYSVFLVLENMGVERT
ncbi:MAG: ABC transporter permease [Candidatus Omnitrophota bacterium]